MGHNEHRATYPDPDKRIVGGTDESYIYST